MKTILLMLIMVFFFANSLFAKNYNNQTAEKSGEKLEENKQNQRVYYWEVETMYGNAKGVSHSESDARKMIALFSKEDYLVFKMITSSPKN